MAITIECDEQVFYDTHWYASNASGRMLYTKDKNGGIAKIHIVITPNGSSGIVFCITQDTRLTEEQFLLKYPSSYPMLVENIIV